MEQIKELLLNFILNHYDPLDFSYDLPDMLVEKYDEIELINPNVNSILNDNLPEICADYERGMDPSEFIDSVRLVCIKAFPEVLNDYPELGNRSTSKP